MKGKTCPICNRPVTWEGNTDRPFCSQRCRMIDLGAWASEEYRVPAETVNMSDEYMMQSKETDSE